MCKACDILNDIIMRQFYTIYDIYVARVPPDAFYAIRLTPITDMTEKKQPDLEPDYVCVTETNM